MPDSTTTLLEELIRHRSAEAVTAMLSASALKVAEDVAKEALADEAFRAQFVAMVRRHAAAMLERLNAPPEPEKPNGTRRRR